VEDRKDKIIKKRNPVRPNPDNNCPIPEIAEIFEKSFTVHDASGCGPSPKIGLSLKSLKVITNEVNH
jgi:hypothetical protein